jgi:hypothetical protein
VTFWEDQGDGERARLQERAANLERQLAQLEQDHAELEMRRPVGGR